jgi:hypothetical protein
MIMDDATRQRVDKRWREYGLDGIANSLTPDEWSGQGPSAYNRLMKR